MKQQLVLRQYSLVRYLFLAIVIFSFSSLNFARHSTSEYDQTVMVEIEGEIVKIFWRNPHVMLHVKAIENGQEVEWTLEGNSVSALSRRGLTGGRLQYRLVMLYVQLVMPQQNVITT